MSNLAKEEREYKDVYVVSLKQRTDDGRRLPIQTIKTHSSGKALMEYERLIMDNEGKSGQGLFVEMQLIHQGIRYMTLEERHL